MLCWLNWCESPNTSSYDGGRLINSDCGRIGVLAFALLKSIGGADGGKFNDNGLSCGEFMLIIDADVIIGDVGDTGNIGYDG